MKTCERCGKELIKRIRPGTTYSSESEQQWLKRRFCNKQCATTGVAPRPLAERFFAKIQITPTCWYWLGYIAPNGYGEIAQGGKYGGARRTHCVAYELLVGPVPEGLELDHLCHNADKLCRGGNTCPHRRCVNPAHLEPVTRRENLRRGRSYWALRTHCSNGHLYTDANTRIRIRQGIARRVCKTCERNHHDAIQARKKASHSC